MNPKYQRIADRIKELINEGKAVSSLEVSPQMGISHIPDKVLLHAWLVKTENILSTVFGDKSAHYLQAKPVLDESPYSSHGVDNLIGVLTGALSDLEDGFLIGQEHLVAGVILDSVLEQAQYLLKTGFKDPSAILCRVVVENALQRICIEGGLSSSGTASALNDALKSQGRFTKPQWRLTQSWLDVGNLAAHGKFDKFTDADVNQMITDVERFLAQELGV